MATEEGIVLRMGASGATRTAWVRTSRSSACESCTSKDSCHMGEGGMEMEVEAINTASAKPGDKVLLRIKTGSFVKATFLLYIFPILCLIAGAFIGQHIAESKGGDPSVMAALVGFSGFAMSFIIIRLIDRMLSGNVNYKPEIIKIRHRTAHLKNISDASPPDFSQEPR